MKAIFASKKKPVKKLAPVAVPETDLTEVSVEIPKTESVCEILPLDDVETTARTLLAKLREERYL